MKFLQDKFFAGPLLAADNKRIPGESDVVLMDQSSWESIPTATHTFEVSQPEFVIVAEWTATLWKGVQLHNTVEHVSQFSVPNYVSRIDNWGFNLAVGKGHSKVSVSLTDDGAVMSVDDGGVETMDEGPEDDARAQGASAVEDVVDHQDIPSYFPGMLTDTDRNKAYEEAIKQCIGDFKAKYKRAPSVVDMGAGTGLLTVYALKHGAASVLAIEGNASRARRLKKSFGKDPRVTVFHGFSTKFNTRAQRDILVTETLGTWVHFEKQQEYIADLYDRGIVRQFEDGVRYVVPVYVLQWLSIREPGEFATGAVLLGPGTGRDVTPYRDVTRYRVKHDPETLVDVLWREILDKGLTEDTGFGMSQSMRLDVGSLIPVDPRQRCTRNTFCVDIAHPISMAPHGVIKLANPEAYRWIADPHAFTILVPR